MWGFGSPVLPGGWLRGWGGVETGRLSRRSLFGGHSGGILSRQNDLRPCIQINMDAMGL